MVERGWIGDKRGQGFYQKIKGSSGSEIVALDLATMTYRPRRKLQSTAFETAKQSSDVQAKLRSLVYSQDEAGQFLWRVLKRVLLYSASLVGVIARDIVAIDQAMKWGFNWELGPFETWDALGVARSVERMKAEGEVIPSFVTALLTAGKTFYGEEAPGKTYYTIGGYAPIPHDKRVIDVATLRLQGKVIVNNNGASLLDIGNGVAFLEFHSPKQAIGSDLVTVMMKAADEVEENFEGLVIGATALPNFCVGANLAMLLMTAQEQEWDEIDLALRQFQNAAMRIKFLKKPVVAAPYGLTLGGGVELC